jgi:response regulator of citrate/malate metabolism
MIPGARLVEGAIASLPTQARLEQENRDLRAQIALLTAENKELKSQLAALQPQSAVDAQAAKILKTFFESDGPLSAERIAQHLQIVRSVVKYHFDQLEARKFIRLCTVHEEYCIEPAGREFIVKNGLA